MRQDRQESPLTRLPVPPSSEIRLLGPLNLVGPSGSVQLTADGRRLLGLLALRANQPVSAAELVDPDRAMAGESDNALPDQLADLTAAVRRAGIPAAMLARRGGYLLRVSNHLVDARRFDRLLGRARHRMAAGDLTVAARLFGAGLLLWRFSPDLSGRPLGGIPLVPGGWAAGEATRLVRSRVAAVEDRWECEIRLAAAAYQAAGGPSADRTVVAAGDAAAGVAAAARIDLLTAVRHHPLRARLWELLLTAAFLADGRRAAAEVADRAEHTFRDQLRVEPGERLRQLARAAQRGDLADEWTRSEVVTKPVAGRGRASATVVGEATGPLGGRVRIAPPRLPVPMTALLGREALLVEVERLLAGPGLVTLTGPGGSGKTRLAVAAAHRAPAGTAWFVDLTVVDDPARVAEGVAAALGVHPKPSHPGAIDALAEAIGTDPALLVLDNCEHLAAGCAVTLRGLLRRCPALRVLATSRVALRVADEFLVRVPPLAAPVPGRGYTLADLAMQPATRLFLERAHARSGKPVSAESADAVARLCAELDGLPLAIELAAAWTPMLSVAEIVRRTAANPLLLRSPDPTAPSRHRTVAAAVETSVRQLDEEARTLFEWLGVVGVGFDVETVRALRGAAGVRALAGLVDASLVTPLDDADLFRTNAPPRGDRPPSVAPLPANHPPRPARYRMLVLIRRHALTRLMAGGGEEAARRAHAGYVVALAERASDGLRGPAQECWLNRLRAEEPNLRTAMRWLVVTGDGLGDLRLAAALSGYWRLAGHYREGLSCLDAALGRHPDAPVALRARAATGAATLAMLLGDYPAASRHAEVARAACQAIDDRGGEARVDLILGSVAAACQSAPVHRAPRCGRGGHRVDEHRHRVVLPG